MKKYILERRSVRNFDPTHRISDDSIHKLITEAQLAPSALNLQPWRFVVANKPETKAYLKQAMFGNFLQFDTASAMIIVINDRLAYQRAEEIFKTSNQLGLMPEDVMNRQIEMANGFVNADKNYYQATNFYDIGLVSMNLVTLARIEGYETSIMRGYDPKKMLELVEMDPNQFEIVSVIAIGKGLTPGFPSYRLESTKTTKIL